MNITFFCCRFGNETYLTIGISPTAYGIKETENTKIQTSLCSQKKSPKFTDEKYMKLLIEFVSFNIYYFFLFEAQQETHNKTRFPSFALKYRKKRRMEKNNET